MLKHLKKIFQIEDINGLHEGEISEFYDYEKISKYILPMAYKPENNIFFMDDNSVGFGFIVLTKPSVGFETLNFLENGIYQDPQLPANTTLQWTLWSSDFIEPLLNDYKNAKDVSDPKINSITDSFIKFLKDKSKDKIYNDWQVPVRDAIAFLTIKMPFNLSNINDKEKYDFEINRVKQIKDSMKGTLSQGNFAPVEFNIQTYLLFTRLLLNPSHSLDEVTYPYNNNMPIKKQVVLNNTEIMQFETKGNIKVDNVYGKVLTVKQYPSEFTVADTREWIGSTKHLNRNQINCKFLYSFVLRKASEKERNSLIQKAEIMTKQKSFSALSTKLQERQDDCILISRELDKGQVLWKGILMYYLFDKDEHRIDDSARVLKNMMKVKNVDLQEELVPLPFFMSALPFNTFPTMTHANVGRAASMLSYNAAHLTPIQFDWKGSGTPIAPFISRSGQLAFVDLWDTNGGMNACVVGPMGQGKSVFVNHVIFNYRSLKDTKVRVVDVGESYLGISKLFGGAFIKPEFTKPIRINPFSNIKNLDRDMDFLINIVDTMIKPKEKCSDTERGMIQVAIRNAYNKYGNDTDINSVKAEIDSIAKTNNDYDFKKLSDFNLSPWCTGGQYADFMTGKSEVDLTNRLVVYELGAIKDDTVLTNVFLLSIFFFINSEIYQGDRNIKKLVIWDEAWRFVNNTAVLQFIEQGAREYRKFNGSLVFITQGISDLMKNDVTKTLKNNSEYIFLFWQPAEEWERIAKDKEIYLSEYEKNLYRDTLRTVKGKYSEILVISRSTGRGILRLVLPPEIYWIYTTDAKEVALRSKFYEETGDIIKAVQKCIEYKK